MNLASYSLKNKKIVFFFLFILLIGGITAFEDLGKKEDSPFVIKQAMIIVSYPGATPQEVERLVTEVVEREVQTMPNLYKISSYSYFGMAKISIELQPYTQNDKVPEMWDVLRRKLLSVQLKLPQEAVMVINDDFGDVYGMYYALSAEQGYSYEQMREWAQEMKRGINSIDGVQRVELSGEQSPVVNVKISLAKLANINVSPTSIMQNMASQNKVINPGSITSGALQIDVYADGSYQTIDDIKNQLITTNDGKQIYLSDVATVEKGYADPATTYMFVNGKRGIGIGVSTASDKDVVATGDKLTEYLDEVRTRLPAGLELVSLYPENVIAREANNVFVVNLIESILIVVFILMFVMGFKASLLIGSSLIFCIGGTLLLMEYFGAGLNRTSLAGFIIAMGMLVDNAIVVTDNAMVNMKRGMTKRDAIIKGATDPQWGLLGATLIAIFSFLPLYIAKASVAEMVSPLFIVIGISLALSWILALTQTTSFADLMFKEPKPGAEIKDPYDTKLYHWFERMLGKAIKFRWRTVTSVVVLFVASMIVFGTLPQNFFPSLDKEYFRADCIFPSGYSIDYVKQEMKKIEQHLLEQDVVKTVSTTLGGTPPRYYLVTGSYGPMANYGNVLVELKTKDSTAVVEERFNKYVRENYPNIIIRSALFKVSPVPDAEIEIGYIGENIDTLISLTSRVEDIMRKSGMVDQVRSSWGNKVAVLKPAYSQEKGQRLGVTRQAMVQNISIATEGLTLGAFRERDQFLPIQLKDENNGTFMLEDIANIPVFGANGTVFPLSQVTDSLKYEYNYDEIRRFNRERIMMAQAEPKRGQNSAAAYKYIHEESKKLPIPQGYKFMVKGTQESQSETNSALGDQMPITAILIFTTLILLFKSYKKPVLILLMIPLIAMGVVLGLVVMGKMFDFFCMLGLLGLVGMNIKNAIVLIDQIHTEKRGGKTQFRSVLDATKSRIVPVTMASGTTILGMLPLLPDAMFGGMAATIMGGLLVATFLTIIVLPVTYCIMYGVKYSEIE